MSGGFFEKFKSAASKVADQTNRAAKLGKLKLDVVSLNSEKNKHLQAIGLRVYTLLEENNAIDGNVLKERIKDEMSQISRIDERIKELEEEIADVQANTQHVDVDDVTHDDEHHEEEHEQGGS